MITDAQVKAAADVLQKALFSGGSADLDQIARAALEAAEAAAWSTDMEAAPKDGTPVLVSQRQTVFEAFYEPDWPGQTWTLANEHWTDAHDTSCEPEAWRLMPSGPTPPTEGGN
ncbi:MAG: hypothetical protein ACTS10_10865 [Kiloniellales bacterium]